MKALIIAKKTLVELLREPQHLLLMLGFPLMLLVIYDMAFGDAEKKGTSEQLHVLVLDEDQAAGFDAGALLVTVLRDLKWEGKPMLTVRPVADRERGELAIREQKAKVLVELPRDFSRALMGGGAAGRTTVVLTESGTPDPAQQMVAAAVEDVVRAFATRAGGASAAIQVDREYLPPLGKMSDFQAGVPGVIVFGVLFIVLTAATALVRESVHRTLRRVRLSRAGAFDLLGGVTLAQLAVALVQVPLTFSVALALGFKSSGSLVLAMAIGLLLCFGAVGIGLVVACFARNDAEAGSLGAGVLVPMAFLSGAMFPLPAAPLFTVAGRSVSAYDILPSTHAVEAMRRVLIGGAGPGDVTYELGGMIVLSGLLLAAGVALFRRTRMREG